MTQNLLTKLLRKVYSYSLKLLSDEDRLEVYIRGLKSLSDSERLEVCTRGLKLLAEKDQLEAYINILKSLSSDERLKICLSGLKLLSDRKWLAVRRELTVVKELDYSPHTILINIESEFEYDIRRISCKKEPETISWIETYIREGDVLYDIGANIGAYSLVASKFTGGKVRVYAFEPGFPTFVQLVKNILLNHCEDSIIPLQVALSATTKLDNFNYINLIPGYALHVLEENVGHVNKPFTPVYKQSMLSYRIDDLVDKFGLPVPNHIKLDVDGPEFEVLKGAEKILADTSLRTLLVEVNEAQKDETMKMLAYLRDKGLCIQAKYERPEQIFNYIFLREA